jgi:hypothetical protein
MSVQAAMEFIQHVRRQDEQSLIDGRGDDLSVVVQIGARMGHTFTMDDLRAAFRHDWQMRWLHSGVAQG